ncbi:MAG TPA: efflux RND transporter periplasmic adaptor subunit [Thermoguttaceae bacterium]|nr:efflux RND transporter periplasmic adaptor subunit [Thermoguttaceae bacterium]
MFAHHPRLLAAFTAVFLTACALCGCKEAVVEEEQDTLPKEPVPVEAVEARLTTLRPSIDLVGTLVVIPERSTVISPQIGGWIQKVSVVEGVEVGQGDELVVLDGRLAKADVAKAKASVAEKKATLARLERGYLPQEIEAARQEVRKCDEQADSIALEVAALEPLWKSKEVPDLQYQKVEASRRAAEAAQAAAQAHLELLLAGTPPEEIAEAEARLAMAHAELAAAKLNSNLCQITSPISGRVTQLFARQGAFAERSVPLLNIDDLSKLFMQVRIPSIHMANVQPGARVDVRLPTYPGQVFSGTVARISGEADPATGDIDAFVEIPNDNALLRTGLACRGRLWLPEMPNVLAIPVAAVADHAGKAVVTVVEDGKAREVEVALGTQTHDQVEITKGLEAGQWVVTEGGYGLPDDCPVKIVSNLSEPARTPDSP